MDMEQTHTKALTNYVVSLYLTRHHHTNNHQHTELLMHHTLIPRHDVILEMVPHDWYPQERF